MGAAEVEQHSVELGGGAILEEDGLVGLQQGKERAQVGLALFYGGVKLCPQWLICMIPIPEPW